MPREDVYMAYYKMTHSSWKRINIALNLSLYRSRWKNHAADAAGCVLSQVDKNKVRKKCGVKEVVIKIVERSKWISSGKYVRNNALKISIFQ